MVIKLTILLKVRILSCPSKTHKSLCFSFDDDDFFDDITPSYLVNYIKSFNYLPKAGMFPVEMGSVLSVMADKKLRTTGISSGMCH